MTALLDRWAGHHLRALVWLSVLGFAFGLLASHAFDRAVAWQPEAREVGCQVYVRSVEGATFAKCWYLSSGEPVEHVRIMGWTDGTRE